MSILGKIWPFKGDEKKEKEEKSPAEPREEKKEEQKKPAKKKKQDKKSKKETAKQEGVKALGTFVGRSVIKKPWVSEKARNISFDGKYVFLVDKNANKKNVKEEVEKRWNVNVDSVNVVRKKQRPKRFGWKTGKSSEMKKAIVTLKEGESIDIYPV